MAGTLLVGESLVGDGNEVAHIDLIIGSEVGPGGRRVLQRADEQQGRLHHAARGRRAEPARQARHDPVQQGHDQGRQAGRADVRPRPGRGRPRRRRLGRERRDPEGQGRRLLHHGRRVHPLGREPTTRRSTTTTTRRPRSRSSARWPQAERGTCSTPPRRRATRSRRASRADSEPGATTAARARAAATARASAGGCRIAHRALGTVLRWPRGSSGNRRLAGTSSCPRTFWPNFFSRIVTRLQWNPGTIDLSPDVHAWPGLAVERRSA